MASLFESVESVKSADDVRRSARPGKGLPRGFDVIMSLLGLVVLSPLLFVAGLIVLLSSAGGAIFRQQRVGRDGRLFLLYKFRTMTLSNHGPQVTSGDDARITRFGRFLRKTKLDELPTLWNVLRGDMALVGPRPEVPRYVNFADPRWQQVLAVRPGITDPETVRLRNEENLLAQVKGNPEEYYVTVLLPQKLKGYLSYLERRSGRSDLKVVFQTIAAIVVSVDRS